MPKVAEASLSWLLQFAQCFRHGSLLCPSSNFILSVSFQPLHPLRYLHWLSFHFIHFSRFQSTGYQLFSSPAKSLGLRSIGAYFLQHTFLEKNKQANCPCVVMCGIYQCKDFFAFATRYIVCTRTHRSSSCSRAAHPRSTRRWLAAHRIANHYIPFHCIPLFATVPYRQPQALLPHHSILYLT